MMTSTNRVYGTIHCSDEGADSNNFKQHEVQNIRCLKSLPPFDANPPLTRDMFSMTSTADDAISNTNHEKAIYFSGSYTIMPEEWDIWLDKFESMLKNMAWQEAKVQLEFAVPPPGQSKAKFTYQWRRLENAEAGQWEFEGGPRVFGDEFQNLYNEANFLKSGLRNEATNSEILERLVRILGRLRQFDEAVEYYTKLKSLNHEVANQIQLKLLKPWAERVSLN